MFLVGLIAFTSCSRDNDSSCLIPKPDAEVAILNMPENSELVQNEKIALKASIQDVVTSGDFYWTVNGKRVDDEALVNPSDSTFTFSQSELGDYTVGLNYQEEDRTADASETIHVYGQFRDGTFVLNEGAGSKENGSVIFISSAGEITPNAYKSVNGKEIGNVTQDLYIADSKIYFISQNQPKEALAPVAGVLVVAHAETLEAIASYTKELEELSLPTHLAVVDQYIYIRDNNGIHRFNPSTEELELVAESSGAAKNRMAVVGKYIFAFAGKKLLVIKKGDNKVTKTIEFEASISGLVKSSDDQLWISINKPSNKIIKLNPENFTQVEQSLTLGGLSAGWGATPAFGAKGETLYFTNNTTTIYSHSFESGETKELGQLSNFVSEDTNTLYNNIGVDPISGDLYLNTILGFGDKYLKNNISVLNYEGDKGVLVKNYKHHTHFPAGVFFTSNFKK